MAIPSFPKHVGIVGSRDFPYLFQVTRFVHQLPEETIIVSGGAAGVDDYAEQAAIARGMDRVVFHPSFQEPIPQRFFTRNNQILDFIEDHSGALVVFAKAVSGQEASGGSGYMITNGDRRGIPLTVYFMDPLTGTWNVRYTNGASEH